MSKRYGRVLAAMVRGLTAPQHPWRRANTRLRAANALFQTHEVPTQHGPIVFISTHPEALHYPRELVGREPETLSPVDDRFTSDEFRRLFGLGVPNYIKLDVDGIEEEILDGAIEDPQRFGKRSLAIRNRGHRYAATGASSSE